MEESTRRKLVTAAVLAVATSLLVLFIAGGQKAPTGPTPIEAVSEAQPSSVEPSVQESGEPSSPTAPTNTLEAATAVSVESLVKQIDQRLKITGASWKPERVPQMLALRCAYINRELDLDSLVRG